MPKPKDFRERPKRMTATRAVAWPDDMLTPWERSKRNRLLRREADPAVSKRVQDREQGRIRGDIGLDQ